MAPMSGKQAEADEKLDIRHPLIRQVAEMIAETTGERLQIVYPDASTGWGQAYGDTHPRQMSAFCKLFQGTPEGAKHCRMCHILMAVAACSGGPAEQRCHAGTQVWVCPVDNDANESIAILSSCTFASADEWNEVRRTGERLGIDLAQLQEAFLKLPKLDEHHVRLLRLSMQTLSQALQVVRQNRELRARARKAHTGRETMVNLERFLEETAWAKTSRPQPDGSAGGKPLLVHVVCELVRQRPDLPLSVKELAAAARLTPNHFTTLFRAHAGVPFTEYLADQRIQRAKKLLRNPTLSIGEVARMVGYDDPGYFTRLFRQKTRFSPRKWRDRQAGSD